MRVAECGVFVESLRTPGATGFTDRGLLPPHHDRNLAHPQSLARFVRIKPTYMHLRIRGQRIAPTLASRQGFNGHFDRFGWTVAKGDAQRERKDDRKAVGPE